VDTQRGGSNLDRIRIRRLIAPAVCARGKGWYITTGVAINDVDCRVEVQVEVQAEV